MGWIASFRRLRECGVLGINRRNAWILDGNPSEAIRLVDDKLRLHRFCNTLGLPTPTLIGVVDRLSGIRSFLRNLPESADCVIKPAHGSGGRGVLVLSGGPFSTSALRDHLADILSGMHSLGGRPDVALVQERIRVHPAFESIAGGGVPDIRVIVNRGEPAMAMLRLPTRASNGRANLHQGGLGVGIDLQTGVTHHAVWGDRPIQRHPDSGAELVGLNVPHWPAIVELSRRIAKAIRLGLLGVDLVLDANRGPLLLEVNARPGLSIQNANARGLLHRPIAKTGPGGTTFTSCPSSAGLSDFASLHRQ
jgi:alpha-L-glutamate ligase-like protein